MPVISYMRKDMNLMSTGSTWSLDKRPIFLSPLSNEQSRSILEFVSGFTICVEKYTDLAHKTWVFLKNVWLAPQLV